MSSQPDVAILPAPTSAAEPTNVSAPRRELAVVVGFVIIIGLLLHLWLLSGAVGVLDADGAIPGLMALHIKRGEFPVFYWGQAYGGSIESILAAGLFLIVKPTEAWLRFVPVALSGVCALLVWRIGRRTVSARAAAVAGCLFWVPPAGLLWWSSKVGTYWGSLCLGLLAVLMLLRAAQERVWPTIEAAGLGLVLGLCWWSNPQTFYLAVPTAAALAPRLVRRWRAFPIVAACALVGALPWLVYNATHHWASLTFPPQPVRHNSFGDHLVGFFRVALPMALGLRAPFSLDWRYPPLGLALYVAALGGFGFYAWRNRGRQRVLLAISLAFPFFYSLSPFSWFVALPRYVLFLLPAICLVVADVIDRRRVWAVVLVAAVFYSNAGLSELAGRGTSPGGPDVTIPVSVDDATALLQAENVRFAFADYWIAYRITFATRERVIVTGANVTRYPPYAAAVRRQPRPAYLFLRQSATYRGFLAATRKRNVALAIHERGPWALAVPATRLLPEEVAEVWKT